jgi:hypothetical protein
MIDADTVNEQLVTALSPAARESPAAKRASEDTGPMFGTLDRKKRFSFF